MPLLVLLPGDVVTELLQQPTLVFLRGDSVMELLLEPMLVFLRGESVTEPIPVCLFRAFLVLGLGVECLGLHFRFILRLGIALGHLNL